MEKTNIIVCGAAGKMGRLIIKLAGQENTLRVKACIENKGHPCVGEEIISGLKIKDDISGIIEKGDVVIDFTVPDSTLRFIEICSQFSNPMVIGTTGFTPNQVEFIKKKSNDIPLFLAPNMSFGVNLFFELTKFAAGILNGYDVEVSEIHHRFKKDAPSGTAKKIAEIICGVSDKKPEDVIRYGREGVSGPRTDAEVGVHALRLGDVVGEHYVFFGGKGEIIELSHRCYNRESFADGAVRAAIFIKNKGKGMYGMKDLIKEVLDV